MSSLKKKGAKGEVISHQTGGGGLSIPSGEETGEESPTQ